MHIKYPKIAQKSALEWEIGKEGEKKIWVVKFGRVDVIVSFSPTSATPSSPRLKIW